MCCQSSTPEAVALIVLDLKALRGRNDIIALSGRFHRSNRLLRINFRYGIMTPKPLSARKMQVKDFMNRVGGRREYYLKINRYYYQELEKLARWHIPENSRVLEIGCGLGNLLASLKPSLGVGIDLSETMIRLAKARHPELQFYEMDAEDLKLDAIFDYVLISDTLGYLEDIQKLFHQLHKVSDNHTRIVITYHNFLWYPALRLMELLHLKMPQIHLNWLNRQDVANLLALEGFEIIRTGSRFIFPLYVPVISTIFNKFFSQLPLIENLGVIGYTIARPMPGCETSRPSVSIVIPARNEEGNISETFKRIPNLADRQQIIFVEGGSADNTWEEMNQIKDEYTGQWDVRCIRQDGSGKGDAVRKGFACSTGEILIILDADLTVCPEDLTKFYEAVASNRAEFANGSRLVYPLEKQSMLFLNLLGNKFFSVMFTWLTGQPVKDTLCGTKALSRKNWERLLANRSYFGDFDPFGDFDLLFGAAKLDLKILEIPVRYHARIRGRSNIARFRHGWLLFKMMLYALGKLRFI